MQRVDVVVLGTTHEAVVAIIGSRDQEKQSSSEDVTADSSEIMTWNQRCMQLAHGAAKIAAVRNGRI